MIRPQISQIKQIITAAIGIYSDYAESLAQTSSVKSVVEKELAKLKYQNNDSLCI